MGPKRARTDTEKTIKRKIILQSARQLFKDTGGQLPTVIEIAKLAGISKGTVYVYFNTKEEIFLNLFLTLLKEWTDNAAGLLACAENADIATAARALARYPIENPMLMHLGGMLHGVLEKNVPVEAVLGLKLQVTAVVEECGILLNRFFPWLPAKEGTKLMLTIYVLFNGLFQITSTPEALKKELLRRKIDTFDLDLAEAMISTATVMLEGMRVVGNRANSVSP